MSLMKKTHPKRSHVDRPDSNEQPSTRNPDPCLPSSSDACNLCPRRGASRPIRKCRVPDHNPSTATTESSRKPDLHPLDPTSQLIPTDSGLSPPARSHTPRPIQTPIEETPGLGADSPSHKSDATSPPRRVKSESPPKRQPEMPWFAVSPSSTVAHAIAGGSPVQAPPCYPIDAADKASRATYEAISEHFQRFPARSREELGDRVALLSVVRRNQSNLLNQIIYPD